MLERVLTLGFLAATAAAAVAGTLLGWTTIAGTLTAEVAGVLLGLALISGWYWRLAVRHIRENEEWMRRFESSV